MSGGSTPDEKTAWLARVLGVTLPHATGPAALATWQRARTAAIGDLNALADKVAGLDHPQRDQAIILLRAVRANLTEAPVSPRQQAELRRYLETDDVIDEAEAPNGLGITVILRTPLLAALAHLEGAPQ